MVGDFIRASWRWAALWGALVYGMGCSANERVDLDIAGMKRNYYIVAPEGLSEPAPLVLVFHGGGPGGRRKGRRMGKTSGFAELAEANGFIAVFPSSFSGNWDDGRLGSDAIPEGVDDLAFVDALIADVAARVPVDPTRIYSTGVSNGGFFTNRLACERTPVFAAFANVIGGMPVDFSCQPTATAPMLLMPGTEDPLVPYQGGDIADDPKRGALIPQEDNQAFWVAQNGCTGEPVVTQLENRDPNDGSTLRSESWTECTDDSEMLSIIAEGGGHGWPGGSQYLPKKIIGRVNQDVDAEAEIWTFFQRHSRDSP